MKIRQAAFIEYTHFDNINDQGWAFGRATIFSLPEDGFWPYILVALEGPNFIWRTRVERKLERKTGEREAARTKGIPSMSYSWKDYQARIVNDPLHLPWVMDGFKSNGKELHVTLARWIIADPDVATLYDMYRPLAGSRAQARTGLGIVSSMSHQSCPKASIMILITQEAMSPSRSCN